jgi:hypothetical protein
LQLTAAVAIFPTLSSTRTLAVWPLSIFHFALDAKDALTLLPLASSNVSICGIDVETTYGAVPPAIAKVALLDVQYVLDASATKESVGGVIIKSVAAAVLRVLPPLATVKVAVDFAPRASVTVINVLDVAQVVVAGCCTLNRPPDAATIVSSTLDVATESESSIKELPAGSATVYGAFPP